IKLGVQAKALYQQLCKKFRCVYDETGAIGKRYRRQDEIGTPFCICVDFETEETQSVTVRDRDTMTQERVKIADLPAYIQARMQF
ncbi:MAG: His/Gly/Thr/Pro-type tRNA ligase C-terminal domain-containing protein, partial [bacterium]|nr:His/Gly/Thr/Pro-type tRNA ligase C-terminal domain-containing protein [bacterium]